MFSRRNIRVKVMQTLYTVQTIDKELKPGEPQKILQAHLDETRSLLVHLIWFLTEVAKYAETYSHQRASKHLPTEDDLKINTKLAGNELLWKILEDPELKQQLTAQKPQLRTDKELVKKIYLRLAASKEYADYINTASREKTSERQVLELILEDHLLQNELFVNHIEELFTNWDDDGEMVIQLLVGYLQKPGSYNFQQMLSADKQLFSKNLLRTVLEKNDHLQEIIKPKLNNWDPERIAQLDMILMKMGVAEFLYFETIPPKVTINEYIDLAKDYSTLQSGQFVNGILDNINKEFTAQGKMEKIAYKKG